MATIARSQTLANRSRMTLSSAAGWYVVLGIASVVTIFPFFWLVTTALKGPNDAVFSFPPQWIPYEPTLHNFTRVWQQITVWRFFLNSLFVATCTVILNVTVSALAAYPLAKMRFPGRELIFYSLLATLIVPLELTYVPGYILAVRVFRYDDTLWSLIFPNVFSAFNIFLLRQAFQAVPMISSMQHGLMVLANYESGHKSFCLQFVRHWQRRLCSRVSPRGTHSSGRH